MYNKCVVITGATSGIGQLSAIEIAKRGFDLILTARNEEKVKITKKLIEEVAPNSKVDFFYGDLSIMGDVKKIGHDINEKYPKIDVLINNVGLHGFEQRITPDGFSEMIAVNYFAPWLLTNILLNSLKDQMH